MDELNKDAKSAFIKERSNRDELLSELIDSLTSWLNTIWSVAYEHNVNFVHAHSCLLFVADVFTQLFESAGNGGYMLSLPGFQFHLTKLQMQVLGHELAHQRRYQEQARENDQEHARHRSAKR